MSNQIQIIKALDALSSAVMDTGNRTISDKRRPDTEQSFRGAVEAAEIVFGAYHGEVGLVLNHLACFYRSHGRYSDAQSTEVRIAEIIDVYQCDQRH